MKGRIAWIALGIVVLGLAAGVAVGVAARIRESPTGRQEKSGPVMGRTGKEREVSLGEFTTNLAERGTGIQVTFVLVVPGEKEATRVESARARLRDAVLGLLREQRVAELAGSHGKDRLAREVQARANDVLGEPLVSRVLVTDIVTQP